MGRYVFKLPDIGEGAAEAEIVAWHVKAGDRIEEDQLLADIMTDKATVELTSPVDGVVVSTHGEIGEMGAVGSPLVVIETGGGEDVASFETLPSVAPQDDERGGAAAPKKEEEAQKSRHGEERSEAKRLEPRTPVAAPQAPRTFGDKPLASPAVRQRAHELGIELQYVAGSGPANRISHADLDAFVASSGRPAASTTYARRDGAEEVKVIGLRRRIAEKMQEAKRRIPHFAYVEEIDVTELEDLRAHLNASKRPDQPKLTLLPFLMRALVRVLPAYPQINATYDDEAGVVHRHHPVHIGIATQTANGLIVPVVRHAETLDVWAAAAEVARVSAAARENKAARDELSGSTITITSLGPLGGIATTPVINHPEVAIIGPNKIVERPVIRNGMVVARKLMNLSSSFDHRVVDGYDAAEFIQRVKAMLEHPATLFMD